MADERLERAGTPDPASPPRWPAPPLPPRRQSSPLLGFLAGVVANFYGRHLTYTILFAQVRTPWQALLCAAA